MYNQGALLPRRYRLTTKDVSTTQPAYPPPQPDNHNHSLPHAIVQFLPVNSFYTGAAGSMYYGIKSSYATYTNIVLVY